MEKHNCSICSLNLTNMPDHNENLLFNETGQHVFHCTYKIIEISHPL